MAKTAFEKALEKKQREDAKNVKKQIDAENKRQQEEARRTRAASIVNGQPMVGSIRRLDKTAEVPGTFRYILSGVIASVGGF